MRASPNPRLLGSLVIAAAWSMCIAGGATERTPELLADFPRASARLESASGTHAIDVWVADNPPRRAQGLMFVRKLAPNTGMLFIFSEAQYVSMWMKNTYVALDMLFIDRAGRIVNIVENAHPLTLDTINSAAPVSAVLELPGGAAKRFGLQAGDRVQYAGFDAPDRSR
jgi:hypothetical protein